jgi:hypothetical protein
MRPTFLRDLQLISLLKYEKKIWIFFDRVQWTHLTMVPKTTPKGLLSYVYQKYFFFKNQSGSLMRFTLTTTLNSKK